MYGALKGALDAKRLGTDSFEGSHVLFSEPPLVPKRQKEKISEYLFESCESHCALSSSAFCTLLSLSLSLSTTEMVVAAGGVGSVYSEVCGVLAAYASCQSYAVVIDFGRDHTDVIPCYQVDHPCLLNVHNTR